MDDAALALALGFPLSELTVRPVGDGAEHSQWNGVMGGIAGMSGSPPHIGTRGPMQRQPHAADGTRFPLSGRGMRPSDQVETPPMHRYLISRNSSRPW